MGGIGSGRHWPNKKVLTTDCRKLDVLELNRSGALKPGTIGSLNWADDIDGHVSFSCEPYNLHLSYHGHYFTEATAQHLHSIPLVWSDCRYGNQRPYFRCTGHKCNNMVEHLYSHGELFRYQISLIINSYFGCLLKYPQMYPQMIFCLMRLSYLLDGIAIALNSSNKALEVSTFIGITL